MRISTIYYIIFLAAVLLITACTCNRKADKPDTPVIFKGLYSFGPEIKSFKECGREDEFWVADSSAQLELQYSQMNFEKPYLPVYIEVEGVKKPSDKDGMGSEYDSTLVVYKLIKITKVIPEDTCR